MTTTLSRRALLPKPFPNPRVHGRSARAITRMPSCSAIASTSRTTTASTSARPPARVCRHYGCGDRTAPLNPLINPYQSGDGRWFMLVASPPHWPGLAGVIGHRELLTDPPFADAAGFVKNASALAELLDSAFRSQPFAHWAEALDGERITYSLIQTPEEAAQDPQLRANDIVVPLEGVSDLEYIVSSPITLRGVVKVPARRAPELGEHTDEVLAELGFSSDDIRQLGADGAIHGAAQVEAVR